MELISGPDLGGGYLFQLTVDRRSPRAHFVVHAQEGGLEAAAPAKGSPVEFGFAIHPGLCPIGGRECLHREYDTDEADLSRVRMTYNRTRSVLGPMIEQRFGGQPVALETGLAEVLDRINAPMAEAGIPWFIGGSTSAWLQGVEGTPRDLDLGTGEGGVAILADALGDYLIEPPAETTWPPGRPVMGARAYVGTLQAGLRVEWCVPLSASERPPIANEWGWPAVEVAIELVDWKGRSVPVARLEYSLVTAAMRRNAGRMRAVALRLTTHGVDAPLLERLLGRSDDRVRAAVTRSMADAVDPASRPSAGS